jgi:magnesium chelatase family protein
MICRYHFRGTQVLARPQSKIRETSDALVDLKDIKAQESTKRAISLSSAVASDSSSRYK